jgi:hypothetical protein
MKAKSVKSFECGIVINFESNGDLLHVALFPSTLLPSRSRLSANGSKKREVETVSLLSASLTFVMDVTFCGFYARKEKNARKRFSWSFYCFFI